MEIAVTVYNVRESDLFEEPMVMKGAEKQIADGLTVRYDGGRVEETAVSHEIIYIAFVIAKHVPEEVAIALIVDWLKKKLGNKKETQLEIDRVTVELDEDKIKRIIHEQIRKTIADQK